MLWYRLIVMERSVWELMRLCLMLWNRDKYWVPN